MIRTIQNMIDEMKSGVNDFTKNGKCISCGACCGNLLPLSSKDIKEIKRYVKKRHIKEQIHRPPTAEKYIDFTCPFRSDAERKCLIYDVRPAICRDFKCDKPHKEIEMSKELFHRKYDVYDMREVFYGKDEQR